MGVYDVTGNSVIDFVANVKDYGAKGNGIDDDSIAIQKALDSHRNVGGMIFFPLGVYLFKKQVFFYSNQHLIFEKGSVILQGASINNLMMAYCNNTIGGYDGTHNCIIEGVVFDGGDYETNNTLFGVCHAKNITIRNCKFVNAYGAWHDIEINSSRDILIENCEFNGSRKNHSQGENLQIDSFNGYGTWPWANGLIDDTISKYVEVRNCHFHDNSFSPAIGNHSPLTVDCIRINDCLFERISGTRSVIDINATNVDVYNNTFISCSSGVSARNYCTCHDNRFIDNSSVGASSINKYNNMVDGELQK